MNFEGFQDLIRRVAQEWYKAAKKEIIELEMVIYPAMKFTDIFFSIDIDMNFLFYLFRNR